MQMCMSSFPPGKENRKEGRGNNSEVQVDMTRAWNMPIFQTPQITYYHAWRGSIWARPTWNEQNPTTKYVINIRCQYDVGYR